MATTSCLRPAILSASGKPLLSIKSDIIKAVERFLIAFVRNLKASAIFVPLFCGSKLISSLMILRMCFVPFLGGINFSTISVKKITPTLSLFFIAEN